MTVFTPTDRRFLRARVKPSRLRRSAMLRRRLVRRLVGLALLVLVVLWTPDVLSRSTVLRIDTIAVTGNERLSRGEVLALLDSLEGQNILWADLEAHRARLLASGWVRDATLRRVLPATVEVRIDEREPVGLGRFGAHLYLIDAAGTLIDEHAPQFADLTLPIIDGLAPEGEDGVVVDRLRAQRVAQLTHAVEAHPELAGRVSQVDVSDAYDVVVLLTDDPTLIHLGHERFAERLLDYLELAPALRSRVPLIDYVDLRFENRIYVRPADAETQAAPRAQLTVASGGR